MARRVEAGLMGLIRVALCCRDAISISLRRCRGSAPTAVGTELSLGICHDVAAVSFSGLGRRLTQGPPSLSAA